jgi:hypothetical protein
MSKKKKIKKTIVRMSRWREIEDRGDEAGSTLEIDEDKKARLAQLQGTKRI